MLDLARALDGSAPPLAATVRRRLAIVLFNLGGPDSLDAVKPFLINLFTDPAILRVPFFIRPLLSRLIAWRRVAPATQNYRLMGGKSPLLELTVDQAAKLQQALPGHETRCFVAMRYWHPFSDESARAVKAWGPDEIVLLPLYPQFSTTTTGSSLTAWREAAARAGVAKPTRVLCCYPVDEMFVVATAAIVRRSHDAATAALMQRTSIPGLRVLFSAHGLPQVIVDRGDPYRLQVERTASAVAAAAGIPALDWCVCFQSRATPQRWLEPSIEQELRRAAADQVAVLVVPIAFVSEHSETLVELDIEYKEFSEKLGIPAYFRAPAQNSDDAFIAALAQLVEKRLTRAVGTRSHDGGRTCPASFTDCPLVQGRA